MEKILAYCLKCKCKVEMKDPQPGEFKNGTSVLKGICPICGMKLFRILPKKKEEEKTE